jgi:hypothetical protein
MYTTETIKPPMAHPESVKPFGYAPVLLMLGLIALIAYMLFSPSQAEKSMYKQMNLALKDFDSAKFEEVKDYRGIICGKVNSKNSMGGYVGFKNFTYHVSINTLELDVDDMLFNIRCS